jgi:hypothetical protein
MVGDRAQRRKSAPPPRARRRTVPGVLDAANDRWRIGASRERTIAGTRRAGYGRESGVCLVDLAQPVPPTKCDAEAGLFNRSLENMMRLPLALESLDHGHVFRVTIWEKRLYELLPTIMRFAHLKIFASRYAAFFDVRFLYTAVSKSRYPVKETGSPKGRICVAQKPPRQFCRSIQ